MIKFKSWRPNSTYEGCWFNEKCEFFANEKQAELLRKSRLFTDGDIKEIGEETPPPPPPPKPAPVKTKPHIKTTRN